MTIPQLVTPWANPLNARSTFLVVAVNNFKAETEQGRKRLLTRQPLLLTSKLETAEFDFLLRCAPPPPFVPTFAVHGTEPTFNSVDYTMSPSNEDRHRFAILKSHKKEQEAEIERLGAEYGFRSQQIRDKFQQQRQEAIDKIDQKEAAEMEKITRSHNDEVKDAKARHSVTLAAVRDKYQIPDRPEPNRSATLATSGSDEDYGFLEPSPTLRKLHRKRPRVTSGDEEGRDEENNHAPQKQLQKEHPCVCKQT